MPLPRRCVPFHGLLVVAAASLATHASASFTVGFSPAFHGAPCSQYAGWETFTQATGGANAPDDPATTSSSSAVFQLAPGGIVTGAGNLDDQTVPPIYSFSDVAPADVREVVLQVAILLNPMDWSSFTLTWNDAGGAPHSLPPTTSTYLLHAMGHDERVITWDLAGVSDTILAYTIQCTATNTFTQLDAVKLDVRFDCGLGTPFCEPGVAGVMTCPCANPPSTAVRGCDNSSATGGAHLSASGTASVTADSAVFTSSGEKPTATTILLQGISTTPGGLAFGQGVRCVVGTLKRLYVRTAVAGTVTVPQPGDPGVFAQSAALGDSINAGQHRYYLAYYRDPIVLGGCPAASTFNASAGLDVAWIP